MYADTRARYMIYSLSYGASAIAVTGRRAQNELYYRAGNKSSASERLLKRMTGALQVAKEREKNKCGVIDASIVRYEEDEESGRER